MGITARNRGDWATAHTLLHQALTIVSELGDTMLEGRLLHNLGNIEQDWRLDLEQARSYYEKSLAIHTRLENRMWMGVNLFELGRVALSQESDAAESLLEQSLSLSRDAGNAFIVGLCLGSLSVAATLRGDRIAHKSLILQALHFFFVSQIRWRVLKQPGKFEY